jgi:peptide/nickel transport system ATP-binding protein
VTAVLSTRDLVVRHRGRPAPALDGVSLDIGAGEIVALVGQSGAGKTTLIRALTGLRRPTSGTVLRHGVPLAYSARALRQHRRSVQWVPQHPGGAISPLHTVADAVAEGLRIHRFTDVPARVSAALSQAGLRPPEEFLDRRAFQLSGGQLQRVVIAGALALEPEVLVADEPVASLDASARGEVLALLLRLRAELGLAALIATHVLAVAWQAADRIAVLHAGRIVETGPVEDVLRAPRHDYTRHLLAALPRPSPRRVLKRPT